MIIGVRAIIKKESSLIMVEHTEKSHGTFFLFPGGGVEEGESIFRATEREVLEETKLTVKAEKILYLREVEYKQQYGLELYVLCQYLSGDLQLGEDPELEKDKQVLTDVHEIEISKLGTINWKPEELHGQLIKDVDKLAEIEAIKNLGLVSLG